MVVMKFNCLGFESVFNCVPIYFECSIMVSQEIDMVSKIKQGEKW